LINFWQKGPIADHIQQSQKINLRVKKIPKDNLLDHFMGTLKENIQHGVHLFKPMSIEKAFNLERKVEKKIFLLEGWPLITIERTMFPLLK
jgi:hypothetical protein